MYREQCLVCGSKNLASVLDLGLHPFADTFLKEQDLADGEKAYPLIVDLCGACGHAQLRCITDPDARYTDHDYSYTSSNSAFARKHWEEYASEVAKNAGIDHGFVVEIGSNDGYLTAQFAAQGNKVLGVDPSPAVAKLAKERGVETRIGLFGPAIAAEILKTYGSAQLIAANNVFNHSDDPLTFTKAVASLLADDGTFVFEQPYWHTTIETGKFDQVYHEHVSYFTVTSAQEVLARAGLKITRAEVVDYHGGSLRIYAKKEAAPCEEAEILKEKERSLGLFDVALYASFMDTLHKKRTAFLAQVYAIRQQGHPIIAVGAAAKGNTLLNFYNLDHKTLAFVTDASEHKQGKYTPCTRIPIRGDEIFAEYDTPYALILSWNISEPLKKALHKINEHITFITPW